MQGMKTNQDEMKTGLTDEIMYVQIQLEQHMKSVQAEIKRGLKGISAA